MARGPADGVRGGARWVGVFLPREPSVLTLEMEEPPRGQKQRLQEFSPHPGNLGAGKGSEHQNSASDFAFQKVKDPAAAGRWPLGGCTLAQGLVRNPVNTVLPPVLSETP